MKANRLVLLFALLATACATGPKGGNGEVDTIYPTQFSSPAQINPAEATQLKYAKSWTRSVGGGFDDFKKVTIPAYTIQFVSSLKDVNQNKFAAAFDKSDGGKSILDMQVVLPVEQHLALLQEITNESHARLSEKLKKLGFEVVDWSSVKAASEDARDFEKNKLNMDPVHEKNGAVSVAAKGLGRLDTIFWGASAASAVRDSKTVLVIPNFTVGFGYFGGDDKPTTIKESHGAASLKFTPQIQVYSGSGVKVSGKYSGGDLGLSKTAVSDDVFATSIKKFNDSRGSAKDQEESARQAGALIHGTTANNIGVSSRAGLSYDIEINPAKFKAAVLAQLDLVENMIVERYKDEL